MATIPSSTPAGAILDILTDHPGLTATGVAEILGDENGAAVATARRILGRLQGLELVHHIDDRGNGDRGLFVATYWFTGKE